MKGGVLMSDYEVITIVLRILAILVPLVLAAVKAKK